MRVAVLVLALCAALANPALGFYLPGVAPQDYARVRGAPPSLPPQINIFISTAHQRSVDFPRTRSTPFAPPPSSHADPEPPSSPPPG